MIKLPADAKRVYLFTGNILNLNELKKKAGQDPGDEVLEAIKVLSNNKSYDDLGEGNFILKGNCGNEDSYGSEELLTSVKVFINLDDNPKLVLKQSLLKLKSELELSPNDSVVLAYSGDLSNNNLDILIDMWSELEPLAKENSIRLGLSDIDTQLFIKFYETVKVKPTIVQINLASCCVVPPALQEFAKENDIQLLTHNDPVGLLNEESLSEGGRNTSLPWAVRYLVHVKCRGVLATKGYLLCFHLST